LFLFFLNFQVVEDLFFEFHCHRVVVVSVSILIEKKQDDDDS